MCASIHSFLSSTMVFLDPPSATLSLLRDSLPDSYVDKVANPEAQLQPTDDTTAHYGEDDEVLAYVASLAAALSKTNDFSPDTWKDSLGPYLSTLPSLEGDEAAHELIDRFRSAAEKAAIGEEADTEDEEDDFGGEVLTNIRFSLAYGGKILLHQTKLRLRRGHKYVLLGQNG